MLKIQNLNSPTSPIPYMAPLLLYLALAVPPDISDSGVICFRYLVQVIATAGALWFALGALASLPWSIPKWSWIVGLFGAALWLALAIGHWDWSLFSSMGFGSLRESAARGQLDPYAIFEQAPTKLTLFLVVRGIGLILLVPLAEELFLRGFLLRYIGEQDWHQRPFGETTVWTWFVAAAYGIASHPAEPLAAVCWFTLITWLARKTKSFAACVIAHAIANLCLFVYVLTFGDWSLW